MLARDRAVLGGYTDREEGGLVVVDRKARCLLKDLQDLLSLNDGFRGASTIYLSTIYESRFQITWNKETTVDVTNYMRASGGRPAI